ncbi:MAG: hemolysin family protein [Alphaproteobacteria bacterium]|nr:hemolysin family protein [Alphaproteobacteria bacterium]
MSNTLYSESAEEPGSSPATDKNTDTNKTNADNGTIEIKVKKNRLFPSLLKRLFRKSDNDIREALADYIDDNDDDETVDYIVKHERDLISNVLKLRDMTVYDVMIPRVDIVAINIDSEYKDIVTLIHDKQHSRIPIYKENLDNTIGFVHLKDILTATLNDGEFQITDIIRDIPILAPSLPVIDLLLQMKETKQHIAMVIDEFGGIDGLVTIEDITEAIVGEISDEFDIEEEPELVFKPEDGIIIADARVYLDDLIEETDIQLGEDYELEDIDTLGGYITNKFGRVPARGEVLRDRKNAIIFDIIDADPRRIKRVRIRKHA